MTRLPYNLPERGPLYKGVMIVPKDLPDKSTQWGVVRGPIPKPKDKTPINHQGNSAFENIRNHQINSLFTLQKHLVDCTKGNREKNSAIGPLRTKTGEYSPCKTKMAITQADDGDWYYECSQLPGLVPMRYGMKSFDTIEQCPLGLPPRGPHKNLVRQIVDDLGIK